MMFKIDIIMMLYNIDIMMLYKIDIIMMLF